MFLKQIERERLRSAREKKKKKSVFVKNQSTARVPFDIPEREGETRPFNVRKSRGGLPNRERERETILKKKRTVRVSRRRRRRRLSGGGGGGSVMMMRAVVVVVVVVVVAILQRREKIHRRCLRSFGGHFCVSRTNLRDGCSRACRAKKRGKRGALERVFVCLLDRTFRDGSRLVSSVPKCEALFSSSLRGLGK